VGVALRWTVRDGVPPGAAGQVAALCAAHPGPAPLLVEWSDDNGAGTQRFRSRAVQVALDDDLLAALEDVLGKGRVELVKAG
jgi:hypothetical protein